MKRLQGMRDDGSVSQAVVIRPVERVILKNLARRDDASAHVLASEILRDGLHRKAALDPELLRPVSLIPNGPRTAAG